MPATPTPKHGLHRPAGGDDADIPADLVQLTDELDDLLAPYDQGVFASRPAPGLSGRRYYATDVGVEYVDTGAVWVTLATPMARGPIADRPAASTGGRGRLYLTTDEGPGGVLYLDIGGTWAPLLGATTRLVVSGGGGAPSYGSSWSRAAAVPAGSGASFWRDGNSIRLGGMSDRTASMNTTIFTLPAGYRPPRELYYPRSYYDTGTATTKIDLVIVQTDGDVQLNQSGAQVANLSLDGISFDLSNG